MAWNKNQLLHRSIPELIHLPFGFTAKVVQIPHAEFVEEAGDGRTKAVWIHEEYTIYLDESRTLRRRRADLVHELLHVVADYQEQVLSSRYANPKG